MSTANEPLGYFLILWIALENIFVVILEPIRDFIRGFYVFDTGIFGLQFTHGFQFGRHFRFYCFRFVEIK